MNQVLRPEPKPSPESLPFWEGCKQSKLLLPRCSQCGLHWFPPSSYCPECWSKEWNWEQSHGLGSLHSFVIFKRQYHPSFEPPYAVGVVHLKEGVRILAHLICEDLTLLSVNTPMILSWEQAGAWLIPAFTPKLD